MGCFAKPIPNNRLRWVGLLDDKVWYHIFCPSQLVISATSENQQIILNLFQNGSYFYDQNLAVTLTDVTDLNALLAYSYGFGVSWPGQAAQTYAFSLNPNDQFN